MNDPELHERIEQMRNCISGELLKRPPRQPDRSLTVVPPFVREALETGKALGSENRKQRMQQKKEGETK